MIAVLLIVAAACLAGVAADRLIAWIDGTGIEEN